MNCLIAVMIICTLVHVFNVLPAGHQWVCLGGVQDACTIPLSALACNQASGPRLWDV